MPEIDYRALARAAGRRTAITLAPIFTTRAQEQSLARAYLKVIAVWEKGAARINRVYAKSLADYTGDSPEDIEAEITAIERGAVQAILTFRREYERWAEGLMRWHIDQLGKQLTYAPTATLRTTLGPASETIEDLLVRNVALVRDVSDQTRGRIADIVFRGLQARTPSRDIGREIAEATGLGRKRANRIAADQTVKAAAALDQLRMEQLGIDRFVWKHSGKRHYRPDHKARDGKVYRWDSAVGRNDPPGRLPFCGCHARAYIDPNE